MRIFGNIKNRSQATEAYHFTSIVGQAITLSLPVAIVLEALFLNDPTRKYLHD